MAVLMDLMKDNESGLLSMGLRKVSLMVKMMVPVMVSKMGG